MKKLLIIFIALLLVPIAHAQQTFDLTVCSDITSNASLLIIFTLISLLLIGIGFMTKIGFLGLFGAIGLLINSIYISPCINIFGFALALLSILLLFYFISRGFFPNFYEAKQ